MLRRLLRRRRRLLAAVAAFLAVLLLVPVLRPAAPPPTPAATVQPVGHEVAMPVPVARTGGLVGVGDRIDLLGTSADGTLEHVARDATVLAAAVEGGSSTLLIGLQEREALPVARAMAVADLVVVLRTPRSSSSLPTP